ncbi:ef-hand calcium-binding domain containing protein [Holotrichia oblita]|uniref:Ef-hand calcium-binding domain containing protein n=1 Tax=Holotrichia oblita TaxID=644536 RepID=A0ACB9T8T5_HOLOL|nr:ef-hand calcium-binding domain containing protein [Holotrichia oblita]
MTAGEEQLNIQIEGIKILQVNECRYLGVLIENTARHSPTRTFNVVRQWIATNNINILPLPSKVLILTLLGMFGDKLQNVSIGIPNFRANIEEACHYKKPLTVHELLEEIDNLDDDAQLPDSVVLFPPDNANAGNTDEDSGEEDDVTIDNLPGSQLNAPVVAVYNQKEDDSFDSEDDVPLSHFAKKKAFEKKKQNFFLD